MELYEAIESVSLMFKQYDNMIISALWWKQYNLMCEQFVQTIKIQEEQTILLRLSKNQEGVDSESKKLFGGCLYDWSQHEFSSNDDFEVFTEPAVPIVRKCLCTNIVGVKKICLRQTCTFAHNVDEWTPEECNYNHKCNNKSKCMRLHGKETKEEAVSRLGIVFMSRKKYDNTRFHILNAKTEKKKGTQSIYEDSVSE